MSYIQVILPLRLGWEPYYRTSCEDVAVGMRASVRFAGRQYVAVVSAVGVRPDVDESRILDIDSLERHLDPIGIEEMQLWRFIADYYLCSVGEVYKLAYPAAKTAGEQVRARSVELHELMEFRRRELLQKRLARLQERLEAKERDLAGRHGDKVRATLEAARQKILDEISEVQASLRENVTEQAEPATGPRPKAKPAGKPLLLSGGPQRFGRLFEAAAECLASGRDVLMLVPDIKLSKSLQHELQKRFPSELMAFNSTESAGRRREIATELRRADEPRLVLGTRSAIFLPFRQLGLVIVEEEHDTFYKQDGAPRYNARDLAVVLGGIFGADVILSSPTPSLESLHNVLSGRYAYKRLPGATAEIEVVDTTVEARKRGMVGSLSRKLMAHMDETLQAGGRVLLLRPWGPLEDIQAEVEAIWPQGGAITYATTWEARRMDISGYALLAIIGTDVLLDRNDFRADEHLWQALSQLRSRLDGTMLVQTRQGSHPAYLYLSGAEEGPLDYEQMLLAERKAFGFPPYTRIVDVTVRDSNAARLRKLAGELAAELAAFAPLGPFAPARTNQGDESAAEALTLRITLARDRELIKRKRALAEAIGAFETTRKYTGHIGIDVDPA